jgi:pimeloyl-ACP methyl ester carboxylesterase
MTSFRRSLLVLLIMTGSPATLHAQAGAVPPGGDPALACKQRPDGRAYWTEYGFCDLPVKGPNQAKGLVLWSHGLAADREQFNGAPPPVVRSMQLAGWDVIRINRNNLHERSWEASGPRHRDDALDRLRAAKVQGYGFVVLAGQSYGGIISLEASAKSAEVDGVLAFSPGHGSDANQGSFGGRERYRILSGYLLKTISAQKGARVVVLTAGGDQLQPDRVAGSGFGAQLRAALNSTGRPYVAFDETSPIRGHGAGMTNQFAAWFGGCVQRFLDPAQGVPAGETVCRPPDPLPRFLLPADLKRPRAGAVGPARWLGVWEGSYVQNRRDVMLVVEAVSQDTATVVYATGSGPQHDMNMDSDRYTKARVAADKLIIDRGGNRAITLVRASDGKSLSIEHTLPDAPSLTGTLSRAN